MKRILLLALLCVHISLAVGQSKKAPARIDFKVKDITPDFLAFYDSAVEINATEQQRWLLWKKMYGFAAVPPTPQGDSIARKLLNDAWPKYAANLPLIRKGASTITPGARKTLDDITALLRPDSTLNITLMAYVGGFEGNAFNMARKRKVTTAVAIETPMPKLSVIMTHELAHAVHIGMGSMSGGWQRTIGATVLSEGVALRLSQKLLPNTPDKDIAEHVPGWFAKAEQQKMAILRNILPVLTSDKPEDVMRFTMGTGPSGLEREAYYAGWVVVGYQLKRGMTFSDIARISEKDMPQFVKQTIEQILKQPKTSSL